MRRNDGGRMYISIFAGLFFAYTAGTILYDRKILTRDCDIGIRILCLAASNPAFWTLITSGSSGLWRGFGLVCLLTDLGAVMWLLLIRRRTAEEEPEEGRSSLWADVWPALERFLPCYVALSLSIYGILCGMYFERPAIVGTIASPTLWILSWAALAISVVYTVWKFANTGEGDLEGAGSVSGSEKSCSGGFGAKDEKNASLNMGPASNADKHLTFKDLLIMLALTVVSAFLIFYRLGNTVAPSTGLTLMPEPLTGVSGENLQKETGVESTFLFRFEGGQELRELIFYQGRQEYCSAEISVRRSASDPWILIESVNDMDGNYRPTVIPLHVQAGEVRLVQREGECEYLEVVFLDPEERKILPDNAVEYQALFDEQKLLDRDPEFFDRTVFDENYYSSSMVQFLRGENMNEQTHPPLCKIVTAIGVKIFGATPFGFRFISAVCGILMVPVMFLFLHELMQSTLYATGGTILLMTDFLRTALSRKATPDTLVALFLLLSMAVLHHCHKRLTQAMESEEGVQFCRNMKDFAWFMVLGITLGISVSLKWTGVFLFIGAGVILMADLITVWRRGGHSVARDLIITGVCIGVVPAVIYVVSFLPVYQTMGYENVLAGAVQKSLDMFSFHKNALRGHEYASAWFTWPISYKPLVDLIVSYGDGKMSAAATFGNPLVWCGHLAALAVSAYQGFCRGRRTDRLLTILYLSLSIPWVFIGRTTYIYQYYGCMLAGTALLTSLFWRAAGTGRAGKRAVGAYFVLVLLCFVLFYPVLTGNAVSASYIHTWLEWGRNWKFTL